MTRGFVGLIFGGKWRALQNFQNCPIFKILPDFQIFARFSKFCPIFKILPDFQNFARFSKFGLTSFGLPPIGLPTLDYPQLDNGGSPSPIGVSPNGVSPNGVSPNGGGPSCCCLVVFWSTFAPQLFLRSGAFVLAFSFLSLSLGPP